ncbi:hypothetical protein VH567_03245 [Sphingomonas sp. 4RDLI-65]|uniref:DUF4760 domain-containing protein n=1 Tax=Sphingomonas sp. 4RDLI-65 TaxID=3111641 RepID=UPI003C212621
MDVENWIAMAGVAIAFGIAVRQDVLTRQSKRVSNSVTLITKFMEPEARIARFRVRSILQKVPPGGQDYSMIDEDDRAALASISSLFGLVSLLDDKNEIELDIILSSFGDSIVTNFERLKDYKLWRDSRHPGSDSLWRHFEMAAKKARERGYTSASQARTLTISTV